MITLYIEPEVLQMSSMFFYGILETINEDTFNWIKRTSEPEEANVFGYFTDREIISPTISDIKLFLDILSYKSTVFFIIYNYETEEYYLTAFINGKQYLQKDIKVVFKEGNAYDL